MPQASWQIWGAFVLVLLVLLIPIIVTKYPPLIDYPNHLARFYVTANLEASPDLQRFYQLDLHPIPYLAADLIAWPLFSLTDAHSAGHLLLGLIVFLWLLAPMILYRTIWGRWAYWPLMAALVIYNAMVMSGALGFLIAAAVFVIVFAAWISSNAMPIITRLAGFTLVFSLLYLGHVVVFAIATMFVVIYESSVAWRAVERNAGSVVRATALAIVPFVPGYVHFFYLLLVSPPSHDTTDNLFIWGDHFARFAALVSPVMQYDKWTDTFIITLITMLLVSGIFFRRFISVHRDFRLLLPVVLAVSLLVPKTILGVYSMNWRIPPILAMIFMSATSFAATSRKTMIVVFCFFCVAGITRIAVTTAYWTAHDREVGELVDAVSQMSKGSAVLAVMDRSDDGFPGRFHVHSYSYATLAANAFVPTNYTGATILMAKPQFRRMQVPGNDAVDYPVFLQALSASGKPPSGGITDKYAYWRTWWQDFTYVLLLSRKAEQNPYPMFLEPVARGDVFALYKVDKQAVIEAGLSEQ